MPFDDENENDVLPKKGLRQVSSQKSILDVKKDVAPTEEKFNELVRERIDKSNDYKSRAGELAIQYKKLLSDKTLQQNKSSLHADIEKEILTKMINLAIEINADEGEQEGMGSLGWIAILLKSQFYFRDKINELEYQLALNKKEMAELKKEVGEVKKMSAVDDSTKSA